ncbi:MAG: DUF1513 domain-containing protein [Pseudomonadota bacterium]
MPLLGIHTASTGALELIEDASVRRMEGYLGSVAMTDDGARVATTSPRSGLLQVFERGRMTDEVSKRDVCGVAAMGHGFVSTTGTGHVTSARGTHTRHALAWDNHLVSL